MGYTKTEIGDCRAVSGLKRRYSALGPAKVGLVSAGFKTACRALTELRRWPWRDGTMLAYIQSRRTVADGTCAAVLRVSDPDV